MDTAISIRPKFLVELVPVKRISELVQNTQNGHIEMNKHLVQDFNVFDLLNFEYLSSFRTSSELQILSPLQLIML